MHFDAAFEQWLEADRNMRAVNYIPGLAEKEFDRRVSRLHSVLMRATLKLGDTPARTWEQVERKVQALHTCILEDDTDQRELHRLSEGVRSDIRNILYQQQRQAA